jgi:UDP-glucose 4-epimerase
MKYLVTGGAGFIGSNLVDQLIKEGHEVVVFDNLSTGNKDYVNPKADFHKGDLSIVDWRLPHAIEGVDGVFHCAALARVQPSIKDPVKYNLHNVNGTLNLLKAASDAGVKRVVYSASSSAYGDNPAPQVETMTPEPMSPYAVQKYVGELYCKQFSIFYDLETVCLRYFNVYGFRQTTTGAYASVIGIFLDQMENNEDLTIVPSGKQKRDYTWVDDIVRANILAMESSKVGNGEVINIGNGDNCSVQEIADAISDKQTFIEARIEPQEPLADNTKAKELLGWVPRGDVIAWINNNK